MQRGTIGTGTPLKHLRTNCQRLAKLFGAQRTHLLERNQILVQVVWSYSVVCRTITPSPSTQRETRPLVPVVPPV